MKKILIIKHGALGDIVLSLYPIFSIKSNFQNSRITILTEAKYVDLFNCLPFINNIKVDNRPKFYSLFKFIGLLRWFKKENFDWVFDLQTSRRTNIYFFLFSLVSNFYWNGIAKNCSHPHIRKNRKLMHTIDRQKDQLSFAGIKKFSDPEWKLLKNNKKKYNIKKPYAIIVPGGSKHRLNKRWKIKNFIKIIEYLDSLKILAVLIGGPDEIMFSKFLNKKKYNFLNLIGKTTFLDIASLSKKAQIIIGNDTGPMHLLVACSPDKTKKIILFGEGSSPELCAPRGKNVKIINNGDINNISPNEIKKIINKKNYSNVQTF